MRSEIVRCDFCRLEYPPAAIGLSAWATVSRGMHSESHGDESWDFCSMACLGAWVAERVAHGNEHATGEWAWNMSTSDA